MGIFGIGRVRRPMTRRLHIGGAAGILAAGVLLTAHPALALAQTKQPQKISAQSKHAQKLAQVQAVPQSVAHPPLNPPAGRKSSAAPQTRANPSLGKTISPNRGAPTTIHHDPRDIPLKPSKILPPPQKGKEPPSPKSQ
jgi:hypothetical protein